MNFACPSMSPTNFGLDQNVFDIWYKVLVSIWNQDEQIKNKPSFYCFLLGWCFYLGFVTVLTSVRIQCRDRFNINGNAFEDFFASLFFYPNVALQLDETTKNIAIKRTPKTDIKMEDAENGKVNKAFENWIKIKLYVHILQFCITFFYNEWDKLK